MSVSDVESKEGSKLFWKEWSLTKNYRKIHLKFSKLVNSHKNNSKSTHKKILGGGEGKSTKQ